MTTGTTRFFSGVFVLLLFSSCLSYVHAQSYKWGDFDGSVAWDGNQTGGLISADTNVGPLVNGVFIAQANDELTVEGAARIKGDIELNLTGDGNPDNYEVFTVKLGTGLDNSNAAHHVTVQAYSDATSDELSHAQLVFNPAAGKTIEVQVLNDSNFISGNAVGDGLAVPLHVSFRGRGTTIFRLPSGRTLTFGPQVSGVTGAAGLSTEGTHVRVLMEQSKIDAIDKRINQVVFERFSYDAHGVNADTSKDVTVAFGQLSSFSFVSPNSLGIAETYIDADEDGLMEEGEVVTIPGYGTVAFDPSNHGTGRFILDIAQGQSPLGNDFTDAGYTIYGNFVASRQENGFISNADLREMVYYNQRAGVKALMRVVDAVAYNAVVTDPANNTQLNAWAARTEGDRRGLMVLNHCNSMPRLASNYDLAKTLDTNRWAQSNTYQTGFVLGNNGEIEINHNMFIDYVADNTNKPISATHASVATTHTPDKTKLHNPAALYVDGLAQYPKPSTRQLDAFGLEINDMLYLGNLASYDIHAKVTLRGHAGLFLRTVLRDHANAALHQPEYNYKLGVGQYNGSAVGVLDTAGKPTMVSVHPEGDHALDIEGKCSIRAITGPDGELPDGYITVPSVWINHAGQEVSYKDLLNGDVSLVPVVRPLITNNFYPVYNRSSILLNHDLLLDTVRYIHRDVTRDLPDSLLPNPGRDALPALVGGEMPVLQGIHNGPTLHFINSTLECHESLVTAGVRFAIHERASQTAEDAHNTTRFVFYNRGEDLDKAGRGRVLQLGSQANYMADGITSPDVMQDSFINVYRSAPTPGATSSSPTTIDLAFTTALEFGALASEKRLHIVYLANGSQISLGWPAEEADAGYVPWLFDDEVLALLKKNDPTNQYAFRFNPYDTGKSTIRISGETFYFGAGDRDDNLPPARPVPGLDIDGVLYVNHGGRFVIENTYNMILDTVMARRIAKNPDASGSSFLPPDQILFMPNGALQEYDITFAIDAQTGDYAGHIRLTNDNTDSVWVSVPR